MRFGNYRNRPGRQADDRLAAIREVWSIFNDNLRNIYVPNEAFTVDEQLVEYCGKIPGRIYISPKPRKYVVNFFCYVKPQQLGFALQGIFNQVEKKTMHVTETLQTILR